MQCFSIHTVNTEGVRSVSPVGGGIALQSTKEYAALQWERFVILNPKGVQVFASDDRDSTGAYLPYGVF